MADASPRSPVPEPRPKRHKIDLACDTCRTRKVKCDGKRPGTSWKPSSDGCDLPPYKETVVLFSPRDSADSNFSVACGNCVKRSDLKCNYTQVSSERMAKQEPQPGQMLPTPAPHDLQYSREALINASLQGRMMRAPPFPPPVPMAGSKNSTPTHAIKGEPLSPSGIDSMTTVLEDGEDLSAERVVDAAGPGAVMLYHATYERAGAEVVDALPGGRAWREAIEACPESERHLAIHAGHAVAANPRDEPHVADLIPLASAASLIGTAEQIAEKIAGFAAAGVTEIVYQPAGPDIPRELRAFAAAAGLPT